LQNVPENVDVQQLKHYKAYIAAKLNKKAVLSQRLPRDPLYMSFGWGVVNPNLGEEEVVGGRRLDHLKERW